MRRLVLAFLVVVTACSGSDNSEAVGLIAVQTPDGNIHVVEPETGVETPLTTDGGTTLYSQPTWSPDGSALGFVESRAIDEPGLVASGGAVRVGVESQAINSSIHIVTVGDAITDIEIKTPFTGFYLYWSPDGSSLAFLGNDADGIGLGLIDIATGSVRRIDQGQPYYFAWSPESDRLLSHVGGDEMYFLSPDGETETLAIEPGAFAAPGWEGDSVLYSIVGEDSNELVLANPDREVKRQVHEYPSGVVAELSPDGETVAYVEIGAGSTQLALGPLIVDTGENTIEVASESNAFFWSAGGKRLLFLEPDRTGEELKLRWGVWDRNATVSFTEFAPSPTVVARYLPFFGQYSNSHSFFSTDATSFVFAGEVAGETGVWIQEIAEGLAARKLTEGVFATWAP